MRRISFFFVFSNGTLIYAFMIPGNCLNIAAVLKELTPYDLKKTVNKNRHNFESDENHGLTNCVFDFLIHV